MAVIPKLFKHKKYFKGKIRTKERNKKVIFGHLGIRAAESARLTPKQLEAARRTIKKIIKPFGGIVRTKARAYFPVTSKAVATRMGRGKGKVALSVAPTKEGAILFEIYCGNAEAAQEAARQGAFRLPLKVFLISKGTPNNGN